MYILFITCVTIQYVTFRLDHVLANSDRLTSLLPLSLINELFYQPEFRTRKKTMKAGKSDNQLTDKACKWISNPSLKST